MGDPQSPEPHSLQLRDGRRLCYVELGAPDGPALIYCHGIFGSRLEPLMLDPIGRELGLRILALDRPGYGLSSPGPHQRLVGWIEDLEQMLDALGLERVRLVGVSGGGPYALAAAACLPDRIERIALVASLAPLGQGLAPSELLPSVRWLFEWARHAPWLLEVSLHPLVPLLRHRPLQMLQWLTRSTPAVDHAAIADPRIQGVFRHSLPEAVRQGPRGVVEDCALIARDWGFELESVEGPVELWHGEADRTVPVAAGRYLESGLKSCHARYVANAGHFSLPLEQAGAILETLIRPATP
jgi:pimeloyl-ACP methyl ester carboxylesterase